MPGSEAYEALRGAGATAWVERDVLSVEGPEARTWLQGQLSQDVEALGDGNSAWSWVLSPQGKVVALVRVTRLSEAHFLIDTDGGWAEVLLERLNRFKLRTRVELCELRWRCLAVRGAAALRVARAAHFGPEPKETADEAGERRAITSTETLRLEMAAASFDWPGFSGVDLLGADPAVPAGLVVADAEEYEAARIEAGFPKMGSELTERTIPAATGLVDRTVSFTKGCYTGQELVARIDARGSNVPRHLSGLRLEARVEPGASLLQAERQVGTLTSVARSPALGWVGLGYLARGVELPADLTAGTGVKARAERLPLRS